MASNNEAIVEEVEALQAIMMDEVTVLTGDGDVPCGVEMVVVPATAQRLEEQHVRVTLNITLPPDYPDVPPTITLRNPRGVDDDVLEKIHQESRRKCDEFLGCPVIYELIEVVRDNLTANNTPSCPCAICLHHFTDSDVFTKTPCFHYFHSYCLGRYVDNCEAEAAEEESEPQPSWMTRERKQLMCPVCRDPICHQLDRETLLSAPPPEAEDNMTHFCSDDPQLLALQRRMASLYLAQKQRGGIIDLEEEKNKFLLSSNRVESCERLGEENRDLVNVGVSELLDDHHQQHQAPPEHHHQAPPMPANRRGGRVPPPHHHHQQQHHHHRAPPPHKNYGGGGGGGGGGYGRGPWRNEGQDARQWSAGGYGGGPGGRGGSRGRGRGGGGGGGGREGGGRGIHHNRIIPDKDYGPVIENGCKDPNKQMGGRYDGYDPDLGAGGVGRKGPKNHNRQRYGAHQRGRGRGPPHSFTPSSQHNAAQDWS